MHLGEELRRLALVASVAIDVFQGLFDADPTGNAFATGFVAKEASYVQTDVEQVAPLCHEDEGAGSEHRASVGESVEINGRVEVLGTEEAARSPSRRERLQLLAAQHASTEFEHLADRRAKGYEAHARVGDVAADAQEFVARETLSSKGMPPRRPPVKDCRGMGVGLHVVDERRAAEEPDLPGKGWLVAGFAAPVFEAFEERGFLPEDVAAGRNEDLDVEAEVGPQYRRTEGPVFTGLLESGFEGIALRPVFVPDEDPTSPGVEFMGGERHPFDDEVRKIVQDFAVLEGAGLAFVGIANHVTTVGRCLGDE